MHHEKNPCLVFTHREKISCLSESYVSRENFIPRKNLRIAGKYSCPARGHTRIKKGKLCIPRATFIHRPQLHSFIFIKINIKKSIKDDDKRNINIASAFVYLFQHQVWNTLKIILQNTRHKLYLLDVGPIESTSNIVENNEVSTW